jgi:uncharacterized protein (TIGR02246 family)
MAHPLIPTLNIHISTQQQETNMKYLMLSLVAAFAVSGTGAVAATKGKVQRCIPVSVKSVEGQFTKFNAAWATKDPTKVTALFTRDAVLLPTVSNSPRTTPEGINDYFVKFLQGSPVGTINTSTVKLGCNMASRLGTWTVSFTDAKTGAKSDVKARYSFIYRMENGAWKIDHLHSSMMPEPTS